MKKLILMMMIALLLSCTNEQSSDKKNEKFQTADSKANIGKGKPQRAVYLKPSLTSNLRTFNGRVMAEPITYTGDTLNLPQTIDFDNDGTNDEVTLVKRCFFPRTFLEISVNGEVVSYSTNFGAKVIGFKDVDFDGFTDPNFISFQTTTYGEWGIWTKDRLVAGHTYKIRFTNLGDNCSSIFVEFTL